MPKATVAKAGKFEFGVERALEMRRAGHSPDFRCTECDQPVRPHREGTTGQGAHFEHLVRNPDCPLSD